MKKISYISQFLAAALIMTACEKAEFLDRTPYTQTTDDNYYKTEDHFKMSLIGAYEAMNTDVLAGNTVSGGTYFIGLMQMMSAPSDEVMTGQNASDTYGAYTDLIKCSFSESTPGLRRLWDACYGGINRCNSVIENSSRLNSAKVQSYVAEARFLRGFYYWYLAQFWGGVPIAVYRSQGMEPRSNLETVYKYILEDMDYAWRHLPKQKEAGAIGNASANRYTAAAYIGRICNYLIACNANGTGKDFVSSNPLNNFSFVSDGPADSPLYVDSLKLKSYTCLKEIVDDQPYVLVDDFRNLFRETTKTDQHKECLFMAENYIEGTEAKFPATLCFGFAPSCEGNPEKGQTGAVWGDYIIPTPKLFGIFHPDDPRRDWFYTGKGNGSVNKSNPSSGTLVEETVDGIIYVKPNIRTGADTNPNVDSKTQTYLPFINGAYSCCGKYRFPQQGQVTTHASSQHGLSIPLMRMADVYFMYAEATYYYKGDENAARDQFRIVIDRATGHDASVTDLLMNTYRRDNFIEELMEMRERELCFEGSRKYDLMRFNLMDKTINDFVNTPIATVSGQERYSYNAYWRQYDNKLIGFGASNIVTCASTIRDNWRPYKIWCPISSLQISANPNLTQNYGW